MNKKSIGGLPLWAVVIGGAILAYAGYRFYKNYQANATTSPAATTASTPASDTSGGAGSAAATPTDLTPVEDLAQALNDYTAVLGAGGAPGIGSTAGGDQGPSTSTATTGSPTSQVPSSSNPSQSSAGAGSPTFQTSTVGPSILGTGLSTNPNAPINISGLAPQYQAEHLPTVRLSPQEIPVAPHQAATNVVPPKKIANPEPGSHASQIKKNA